MMKAKNLGVILLVMALLYFLSCQGVFAQEKKVIRVGSPFKAGHISVDASEKFKELAEKGSGGRIEVQVQPGVGSEEEIDDWCSKGKVEMQAT